MHIPKDRRNFGTLQAYINGSISDEKYKNVWVMKSNLLNGTAPRHLQKFKSWQERGQNDIKIVSVVKAIVLSLSRV